MQRSKEIKVGTEGGSNLPVVVGNCPSCESGPRSLILLDFVPNLRSPEHGNLYFKCLKCFTIVHKRVCEVTEED